MQELLNEFNFQDKKFNPRNVKADMLSPSPDDRFANDVKQLSNLLKNSPNIYGKDIVRITTQGKVDTKKVTKAALKVTGNLIQSGLGLFGKIGKAAGSAINDTLNTTTEDTSMHRIAVKYALQIGTLLGTIGAMVKYDNPGIDNIAFMSLASTYMEIATDENEIDAVKKQATKRGVNIS